MITEYTKSNSQKESLQKEMSTSELEFTKNKKSDGKKLKRKVNKSHNRKLKAERDYL